MSDNNKNGKKNLKRKRIGKNGTFEKSVSLFQILYGNL